MSDQPTSYVHRRCEKCQRITRTRAKKAWNCPHCGKLNRIINARPQIWPKRVRVTQGKLDP